MKTKRVVILTGCMLAGVSIVFVLYAFNGDKSMELYKFNRLFPSNVVTKKSMLNLGHPSYYIAGATADKLYFGNLLAPLHMLESDRYLKDTTHIKLKIKNAENLKFKSIQVKVDSPYFFITEGTQPYLLRGSMSDWNAKPLMRDSIYFSLAVPISPTSFVLRSQSVSSREDELGKETEGHVNYFPALLEKQIDGVFCVDGMLHYNKDLQAVVYVYYYRNQYVVMDTSLNLLYRGNTIDPISKAQIKADSFTSEGARTYTMSAPPLMVNQKSCVYGNWLLVNSTIRAQNESKNMIDRTSVIDVYDLKTADYRFSFYLENYDKFKGLWLFGKDLYAMSDQYVVSYTINEEFFRNASGENL